MKIFYQKTLKILALTPLQYLILEYKPHAGDYCERVIPDPIPNSEVKPSAPMILCLKTDGPFDIIYKL